MDRLSLALANALAGNHPTEAALEFAYAGGEWRMEAETCRIAIAGGAFDASVDGVPLPPFTSAVVRRGQCLRIGGAAKGVWGYLAVAGGFDVAPSFGSRSTHQRTGIGGQEGRAMLAGDGLPLRLARAPDEPERASPPPSLEEDRPIRVIPGPQEDYFEAEALRTLTREEYRITWKQDRMAYRLDGPRLVHRKGYNIITEGVTPGCVQIPGSGSPIVLMADAPTVGGYPKIAVIIDADLGRMAQRRPGNSVRFQAVGMEEAVEARRVFLVRMALLAERLEVPRAGQE